MRPLRSAKSSKVPSDSYHITSLHDLVNRTLCGPIVEDFLNSTSMDDDIKVSEPIRSVGIFALANAFRVLDESQQVHTLSHEHHHHTHF